MPNRNYITFDNNREATFTIQNASVYFDEAISGLANAFANVADGMIGSISLKSNLKKIPADICEAIATDMQEILSFSQDLVRQPKVDTIVSNWAKNKAKFYHQFGDKLIYETELLEFGLDEKTRQLQFQDFVTQIENINMDLALFLSIRMEDFFNGHLLQTYECEDFSIPKGSKMIKAFKYFIDDEDTLSGLQELASRLIQENKIKGHLCFSIHPLDFLSSSENTYNWRSCHSLDGEYAAGNLSYMQDECTVMCYIKTSDNEKLPNFPDNILWNSKKWRMLLFISENENAMFAGRQYPFSVDGVRNKVLSYFKNEFGYEKGDGEWSPWSNKAMQTYKVNGHEYPLNEKYFYSGGTLEHITDMVKDAEESTHYNDLLYSSCYKPFYTFRASNKEGKARFHIGSSVPCLYCQSKNVSRGHGTFLCDDCRKIVTCGECHEETNVDTCYRHQGQWLCPKCFERLYATCPNCGWTVLKTQLTDNGQCEFCKNSNNEERNVISFW